MFQAIWSGACAGLDLAAFDGEQSTQVQSEETLVSGVTGRYATALFELGLEQGDLDQIESQLLLFQEMLDASGDLRRLVRSPAFSAEQQAPALRAVLERAGISGTAAKFLLLLVKNRRLFAIEGIIRDFRLLTSRHRGEIGADVISAVPLNDGQREAVKDALRKLAGKEVQMNLRVDPSILGGLIVKMGSRMIDDSLRSKLNRLKFAMKEVG